MKQMAASQPDTKPRKIIFEYHKNLEEEVVALLPAYNPAKQLCSRARIDPEHRNWLCDGTFDAVPLIFEQLFTVHVIKQGKNLIINLCIIYEQTRSDLTKFFNIVKSKVKNNPLSVYSDYELAIINSIKEIFPEADVFGCYFHLKKSIWRHIQSIGLAAKYSDLSLKDNLIRKYSKMLACLAFVPVDYVIDAFEEVQSLIPNELKKVYTYFEDNYIGAKKRTKVSSQKTPRFSLELWNCYERTKEGLPRTNNYLEGWHNALQSTIKSHPHLLSLIDSLKPEQSNTENVYIKPRTGQVNKRKAVYMKLEEQITTFVNNFNREKVVEYLNNLSLLIEY
ncbi:hypothetical protein BpHYR1_000768 [Brachionus plicatilis]|uniref:MULE transposase domain-containing protein n=1 Tax=Brachionus plicatilis TaxID=10195 RepID=A0A3M7QNJ8_BRAPC|nr:hypothetical protein BpHYR1_000768 [Brachionus plicatilis]